MQPRNQPGQSPWQKLLQQQYELPEESRLRSRLAPPWKRIAAFAVNIALLFAVVAAGNLAAGLLSNLSNINIGLHYNNLSILSLAVILAYLAAQISMMGRSGQSFGKKIMGIRVATESGGYPGFKQYVLLREAPVCGLLAVLAVFPVLSALAGLLLAGACIIMMFVEDTGQRTLQDILAGTVVIMA